MQKTVRPVAGFLETNFSDMTEAFPAATREGSFQITRSRAGLAFAIPERAGAGSLPSGITRGNFSDSLQTLPYRTPTQRQYVSENSTTLSTAARHSGTPIPAISLAENVALE